MADTKDRVDTYAAGSNGVGVAAAPAPTRTRPPTDDDNGTTVKLSDATYQVLRELRTRLGKRNDAVIRRALWLLDADQPGKAQTDDEWADEGRSA